MEERMTEDKIKDGTEGDAVRRGLLAADAISPPAYTAELVEAAVRAAVAPLVAIIDAAKAYETAWTVFSRAPDANATDEWVKVRVAKGQAHQSLLDAVRAGEDPHGE
jgi:hypothetical protein